MTGLVIIYIYISLLNVFIVVFFYIFQAKILCLSASKSKHILKPAHIAQGRRLSVSYTGSVTERVFLCCITINRDWFIFVGVLVCLTEREELRMGM